MKTRRRAMDMWRVVIVWLACSVVWAAGPRDGATIYKQNCAECHDKGVPRAANRDAMKQLSPAVVLRALESGSMAIQGAALTPVERRTIAEFLTGKPLGNEPDLPTNDRAGYCADAPRGM